MRTPANNTKHFMNDLINTMNAFFKKISNNKIQFQLSEYYTLPKKGDINGKTKGIKKAAKLKMEQDAEKLKMIKKAFKKFKESLLKSNEFLDFAKDLNEKDRNKRVKVIWKGMSEDQKLKWCTNQRKKRDSAKLKAKNGGTKAGQKQSSKQQKQKQAE